MGPSRSVVGKTVLRKPQVPDASLGVLRYPIAGSISLSLALRLLPFVDVADAIQYLVGIALLTLSVPEGPGRWGKGAR